MKDTSSGDSLWMLTYGEIGEIFNFLSGEGITKNHFLRLPSNPAYLKRVAVAMLCNGNGPISIQLARTIMGDNFFGAEDWETHYGVRLFLRKKLLSVMTKFPWGEDVLNAPCPFVKGKLVKETHFAFLGISDINGQPLTVAKWIELHPATGQPKFYFHQNPWHKGQPHTDMVAMQLRWYLVLKDIVPGSTNKTPEEQVALLPVEYGISTTIIESTKDILVFRKTGKRPNYSRWAACSERTVKTDSADAGLVSCVGYFGGDGLLVGSWAGSSNDGVGLGASRKFPR